MKLSSPIYVLKGQAKDLKTKQGITMSQALDKIAQKEGLKSWSLLISKRKKLLPNRYSDLLQFFNNGDLVLIGSRPGKGKTSFTIGLFVQAIEKKGPKGFCFTLAETHKNLSGRIATYNELIGNNDELFGLNYSNDISADYIISVTKNQVKPGSIIIVDYLQLLDERRTNPPLQNQVKQLKEFAKKTGCITVFLSQIDRKVEYRLNQQPTLDDIRLPNPLDVNLLNKIVFLHRGKKDAKKTKVILAGKTSHTFNVGWNPHKVKFFDI